MNYSIQKNTKFEKQKSNPKHTKEFRSTLNTQTTTKFTLLYQ